MSQRFLNGFRPPCGATVRERQGVDFRTQILGLKDGGIASPRRDLTIRHPPVAIGSVFTIDVFLILQITKSFLYTAACARVATVRERQGVDFRTQFGVL